MDKQDQVLQEVERTLKQQQILLEDFQSQVEATRQENLKLMKKEFNGYVLNLFVVSIIVGIGHYLTAGNLQIAIGFALGNFLIFLGLGRFVFKTITYRKHKQRMDDHLQQLDTFKGQK